MDDEISTEGSVRIPLFWIKYSDLQPYLSQQPVMLSPRNNAKTATMDDFFSLNLYRGLIAMTLGGETAQLNSEMSDSTATAARIAFHNQITGELQQFEESLYGTEYQTSAVISDEAQTVDTSDEPKLNTARARRSQELHEEKSGLHKATKTTKKSKRTKKAPKSEPSKQTKSPSKRSVRNRF